MGSLFVQFVQRKAEPNRTRFTVGGNCVNYPGEVATPAVARILFNSMISTKGAKFMVMDISSFYLTTPLKCSEYIHMKMSDIPQEIIHEYKLHDIVTNRGSIYIVAKRDVWFTAGGTTSQMSCLRSASGSFQSKYIPGLWKHKWRWRLIQFSLIVDDFRVKCIGEEHALHLKSVLEKDYKVITDWTDTCYIGITLPGTTYTNECT